MGDKLIVKRGFPIRLPFSLPGKRGQGAKMVRAAIFCTQRPFWSRRSAVPKMAAGCRNDRNAMFNLSKHRNAIALATAKKGRYADSLLNGALVKRGTTVLLLSKSAKKDAR